MTDQLSGREALDALYWRAEILQALYWMRGEGLAEVVEPTMLAEFLVAELSVIAHQLEQLADDGSLEVVGRPARYRLTPRGIAEGGRGFRDEFEGMMKPAHGECSAACWCKDPDHAGDPCPSEAEPGPSEAEPARGN